MRREYGLRQPVEGAAPAMGLDQVEAWLDGLVQHADHELACAAAAVRQCLDQLPLDAAQRHWRRQVETEAFKALRGYLQ